MPTLSRLIGGAGIAVLAWLISAMIEPDIPEAIPTQWFAPVNAALGALFGWELLGHLERRGIAAGIGAGLSTGLALYASACGVWAVQQMLRAALRLRLDGPGAAIESTLRLFFDFAALGARWDVAALLLGASAGVGALADLTAERGGR